MESYWDIIIAIAGFGIVAIAAAQIAGYFRKIKLPLITGLLITGIAAGPFFIGLIPSSAGKHLNFINDFALAYIAFAASAELYLREMKSRIQSIKWMTISQLVVTFVLSGVVVYFISGMVPFMKDMSVGYRAAVASLFAVIFVARSPASAIAIVNEMRAKGPFVQTAIGVTVLKDVFVILLFSICLEVAVAIFEGTGFTLTFLAIIAVEIISSVVMGFLLGMLLVRILKANWRQWAKTILILLSGYLMYVLHHELDAYTIHYFKHSVSIEPLLVCIIASFRVTNYSKFRAEFLRIIERSARYIYIPFFLLAGATLQVDMLAEVAGIALVLFLVRLLSLVAGGFVGGTLAGDPPLYNRLAWMPYVTQAGVGLGLATVVAKTFPEWGLEFSTIVISVIVVNQIVGPPLFKWAINKVKEGHTRADTPAFDGIKDAIIFGFESQSVALARQLQEAGWEVKIATLLHDIKDDEYEDLDIRHVKDLSLETLNELDAKLSEAIVLMLTDEENLELCNLIYEKVGTKDVIVRLNSRYNLAKFHELGALIVDPSTAIVSLMDHFVRSPQAASLLLGMQANQDSMDIQVLNPDLQGISLRNLRLPSDIIVLSVKRRGNLIISHGYTRLRLGDTLTMVGSKKSLSEVSLKFGY
ncbi:MAG: cation:proton antiporter [Cyclobacteriaceae bacterium]|nr:cation:proton antiporter [Cyclobacteriaceae bacterium]